MPGVNTKDVTDVVNFCHELQVALLSLVLTGKKVTITAHPDLSKALKANDPVWQGFECRVNVKAK